MVVWLYGSAFERDPYECNILIELWFRKMSILTGINHTTYATAPILQKRGLEEYISNCRVLRIRMMRLLDGLNSQFVYTGLTLYSARKQLNEWTEGDNPKLLKTPRGKEHIYTEI